LIATGRTIQYQVEPLALPVWQDLLKKLFLHVPDHDARVRYEAGRPPWLSVKLMAVANSKIVPGTHRQKLKSVLGFAIRHKHHIK
jgi:hypothetical protein